jgi:hypothetical protein
MTKAEAADLRPTWKQQGDPPSLCEHPIQDLAQSGLHDEGYLLDAFHCRACGETIVHTYKKPRPFSNSNTPSQRTSTRPWRQPTPGNAYSGIVFRGF